MPKGTATSKRSPRRTPTETNHDDGSSTAASWKKPLRRMLMLITFVLVAAGLMGEAKGIKSLRSMVEESRQASVTEEDVKAEEKPAATEISSPPNKQEEEPKDKPLDEEGFKRRVSQAKQGLGEMDTRQAFTTTFTSKDKVLEVGFPQVWKPCVLEAAFQKHQPRIQVAVVGGSTAARPGNRCPDPTQQTDGRFSTLLEQKLRRLGQFELKFAVRNLAQGGTTSVATSLLLDGLIDPKQTDVIVWDFLVNDDAYGGGTAELARKLDFFLTRVQILYANVNGPPPAIVIMFLWNHGAREVMRQHPTLDAKPMEWAQALLKGYTDLGWNIAVLNVGATIDTTAIRENPGILLDDNNHPSCLGTNLIADMLQHLLYTHMNQCTWETLQKEALPHYNTLLEVPPHTAIAAATETPQDELWQDLFKGKIGSISAWEPQTVNRTTALTLENLHGVDTWQTAIQEKADYGRDDRKKGFLLPKCAHTRLLFPLKEPHLAWIGLSVKGDNVRLELNHDRIEMTKLPNWGFGVTRLTHWIQITEEMKTDPYEILICDLDREDAKKSYLQFFIGVMIPSKQLPKGNAMAAAQ